MLIHGIDVRGLDLDSKTRCRHYHTKRDVIAIKCSCCLTYYACHACHLALADHSLVPWPDHSDDTEAVLCGVCGLELGIGEYLVGAEACPRCHAEFNPKCALHHDWYFHLPSSKIDRVKPERP